MRIHVYPLNPPVPHDGRFNYAAHTEDGEHSAFGATPGEAAQDLIDQMDLDGTIHPAAGNDWWFVPKALDPHPEV